MDYRHADNPQPFSKVFRHHRTRVYWTFDDGWLWYCNEPWQLCSAQSRRGRTWAKAFENAFEHARKMRGAVHGSTI